MELPIKLHCTNSCPPILGKHSAIWEIHELPGVWIHTYPSTSDQPGWRMEMWDKDDMIPTSHLVLDALRGQVFETRKDLIASAEAVLALAAGQDED